MLFYLRTKLEGEKLAAYWPEFDQLRIKVKLQTFMNRVTIICV